MASRWAATERCWTKRSMTDSGWGQRERWGLARPSKKGLVSFFYLAVLTGLDSRVAGEGERKRYNSAPCRWPLRAGRSRPNHRRVQLGLASDSCTRPYGPTRFSYCPPEVRLPPRRAASSAQPESSAVDVPTAKPARLPQLCYAPGGLLYLRYGSRYMPVGCLLL